MLLALPSDERGKRLRFWPMAVVLSSLFGCAPGRPPILDNLSSIERAHHEQNIKGVEDPNASLLRMGDHFGNRGDRAIAVTLYMRGLDGAESAEVKTAIGRRLLSLDAVTEAAVAYRRAIAHDSSNKEAREGFGLALLRSGQIRQSIGYFESLVRDRRYFSIEACKMYGVAFDLNAQHEKAQKVYRKCLKKEPDSLDLRSNLALSLAMSQSPAKAIIISERTLLHPLANDRHVRNHVLVLALASKEEEALQLGETALGRDKTLQILRRAGRIVSLVKPIDRARAIGIKYGVRRSR